MCRICQKDEEEDPAGGGCDYTPTTELNAGEKGRAGTASAQ
jgi:hypothetical protein